MKSTPLLLACLLAVVVGQAEGYGTLFATGTIQRLTIDDYQLDLSYFVYPNPYDPVIPGFPEYDFFYWDVHDPREKGATLTGNFSPSPYVTPPDFYDLSVILHLDDPGTLFLHVDAWQDWMYEKDLGGFPVRTYVIAEGQGNFLATLPQEIGSSSVLTQTPEASSFFLLAMGLLPLALLPRRAWHV